MMTKVLRHSVIMLMLFASFCLIAGCKLIAEYNQVAYEYATSLKAEALALMEKASEPYADHEEDVEELMLEVEKAYEYANGLPKNEISAEQWKILKDKEGTLLGSFIELWKKEGQLSEISIVEAKEVVSKNFDQIIELEVARIR